jgi:superfamily II DNA helicase RecQ
VQQWTKEGPEGTNNVRAQCVRLGTALRLPPAAVAWLSRLAARARGLSAAAWSPSGAAMSAPGLDAVGALKRFWGYSAFRPAQHDVIQAVLAGRDALVIMATGSGKSIWCAHTRGISWHACE